MAANKNVESRRLFPTSKPKVPQRTPLSILDATVARFTPTGAVWVFDELPRDVTESAFLQTLEKSFIEALNEFPQWAGQLRWAEIRPGGDHTARFGRPLIEWGSDADTGVEWGVVRHPFRLEDIVPAASKRSAGPGVWRSDEFPQHAMISSTPLPLHNLVDYAGLPAMAAQVNLFAEGGGYAIGVKMAHVVADAQTLLLFMGVWAAKSRALFSSSPGPSSGTDAEPSTKEKASPVFDPAALDARAAGDIDGPGPDPGLSARARTLPLHRHDWWDTEAPGFSPALVPGAEASRPTPEQLPHAGAVAAAEAPETRAPWHTWDLARPNGHALLHFRAGELERMRSVARAEASSNVAGTNGYGSGHGDGNGGTVAIDVKISRLDALLAHLFRTVNRARVSVHDYLLYSEEDSEVYLNVTLDARRRVDPPLPTTFVGSPLFLTHIKTRATSLVSSSGRPGTVGNGALESGPGTLGEVARELRRTMQLFTPDAVAAMLHDAAHEPSPQRLWQGFLGARHLIVTSWLRLPLYNIDFVGAGGGEDGDAGSRRRVPRYVHPVMMPCDGIILVMDSPVEEGAVDVSLFLDREVLQKLLTEEEAELRRFRG